MPKLNLFSILSLLLIAINLVGVSVAQEESPAKRRARKPKPIESYMGREIAMTMHYAGAEWLIRNEREREERCSLLLDNLGLKTGMTVCDMGCGNGFYAIPIAKLLGPKGRVLAVDIQPEMLFLLRERMELENVDNVTPILGSVDDPYLPAGTVDLAILVDVYHEFGFPEEMLAALRKSLKPDGRIVLVEFRAEDDDVPIKPEHKMTKKQVNRELVANGFKLDSEFNELPWQHVMFFKADPNWEEK
jgi:ubiquinone/menaquinone biosynthesis C-methylase UbiE